MKTTGYTVHGVLAGAYRGKGIGGRALLQHASIDGATTSLCKRTANLCDAEESGNVDCPECLARIARRNLTRAA